MVGSLSYLFNPQLTKVFWVGDGLKAPTQSPPSNFCGRFFLKVTAEARDEAASIEVLKSCNWNAAWHQRASWTISRHLEGIPDISRYWPQWNHYDGESIRRISNTSFSTQMIPKLTGVLIVAGCLNQQHIVGNTEVEQALSLHWASHDEAQMQPVNGGIYVTNKQCGHEPTESEMFRND